MSERSELYYMAGDSGRLPNRELVGFGQISRTSHTAGSAILADGIGRIQSSYLGTHGGICYGGRLFLYPMSNLTPEEIREFQRLWKEEIGEDISLKTAKEYGQDVFELVRLVYSPQLLGLHAKKKD